jgi:hypothetical protein
MYRFLSFIIIFSVVSVTLYFHNLNDHSRASINLQIDNGSFTVKENELCGIQYK